jgi:hypothetical protein
VIVRENGALKLVLQGGGRTTITASTILPADVLRYTSTDVRGQVFYAGGEPAYHRTTDPVQVNRQFARLTAGGMTGQLDWVGPRMSVTPGGGERRDGRAQRQRRRHAPWQRRRPRAAGRSAATTINAGAGADVIDVFNDDARLFDIDALHHQWRRRRGSDTVTLITFDFEAANVTSSTVSGRAWAAASPTARWRP